MQVIIPRVIAHEQRILFQNKTIFFESVKAHQLVYEYEDCEVIIYPQDDPSVGQTVFHSHEQVVAADPKTIDLSWTMMSLYSRGNVSSEEMLKVREEFGLKLQQ